MLHDIWFLLIAVLWIGYFVLEGFDFGLGILLPFLGRNDAERRALIGAIGPVWDGNEVWLLVAGGATFAAFPHWYATLFSGFYLALFLILVALILRGVAFEYRGKRDSARWRRGWDWAIFVGSAVPALLWGVAFANIVGGVPIDQNKEFTGDLLTLLNPFGLLGGVVTLTLFMTHGAAYIALKTEGELRERANKLLVGIGLVAAVAAVAFLAWTQASGVVAGSAAVSVLAAVALVGALASQSPGPRRLGLHRYGADHRSGGRRALPAPVPERDAVVHKSGLQPDGDECVFDRLHPDDHDRRGRGIHAAGPALSGLDILDLPQAGHRRPRPGGARAFGVGRSVEREVRARAEDACVRVRL